MYPSYYACWFRLDGHDRYIIWMILRDVESVLTDADRQLLVFPSEADLAQFARLHGITLVDEEPLMHDLDAAEEWAYNPSEDIDCKVALAAWNLFTDVSYGVGEPFIGDRRGPLRNRLYDKLFYGNNVFGITPNGEYYIPKWSRREWKRIAFTLRQGIRMFRKSIIDAPVSSYRVTLN